MSLCVVSIEVGITDLTISVKFRFQEWDGRYVVKTS